MTAARWLARYDQRRRLQGFSRRDAARLASGRPCDQEKVYDVPFWLHGRLIATVRVPAAHAYGAERFAERYLFANLYPHKTAESAGPLPPGGREINLAGPVRPSRRPASPPEPDSTGNTAEPER